MGSVGDVASLSRETPTDVGVQGVEIEDMSSILREDIPTPLGRRGPGGIGLVIFCFSGAQNKDYPLADKLAVGDSF